MILQPANRAKCEQRFRSTPASDDPTAGQARRKVELLNNHFRSLPVLFLELFRGQRDNSGGADNYES